MSQRIIGNVCNFADERTMQLLALWKESVSIVELKDSTIEELLYEDYSHYIVVHDPLRMEFPQKREEWNRRFCSNVGVSVVELIKAHGKHIYFKGLFAHNGSFVYGILPYTSFDRTEADFPHPEMEILKKRSMSIALSRTMGNTILDVGCGIGSTTLQIAKNNPGSEVTGIDLLKNTIEQCRLNAAAYDVKNAKFTDANVYALPFEDNTFDTVTCFFMLHHLDNIAKALKDIKRVLSIDGTVLAVEPLDHHHGTKRDIENWEALFKSTGFSIEVEQINRAVLIVATPV